MWRAWRDQGVRVWGIASREHREIVELFAEHYGLTYPILLDENGEVNLDYHQDVAFLSAAYPQDFVIGTDGRTRLSTTGSNSLQWRPCSKTNWRRTDAPPRSAGHHALMKSTMLVTTPMSPSPATRPDATAKLSQESGRVFCQTTSTIEPMNIATA